MNKNDLLGKKYPIKNTDNVYIASRIIQAVFDLDNVAGYAISLNDQNPEQLLVIGYRAADDIINGKFDYLMTIDEYRKYMFKEQSRVLERK